MQQTLLGAFKGTKENKDDKIIVEGKEQSVKKKVFLPWVEKYRPNSIDEISYQDEVTQAMAGALKTGNLPHLLFYGPPGTGKTSCVLAISKQLFGPEFYRKRILELNASDDRGIGVVREKIKKFAETAVTKNPDPKYPSPSFKIIILDEADLMTNEAQSALRRIIEDNSSTTRFCIICNYITKIIEPLSSRCVKFRFKPISIEAQLLRLKKICEDEALIYDEEGQDNHDKGLLKLIEVSEGDLRKSINVLQSTGMLYDRVISEKNIIEISGIVPHSEIKNIFTTLRNGNIDKLMEVVDNLLLDGFSPEQIISQYCDSVLQDGNISELKRCRILEKISFCEQTLNEGGRDDLQLYNLFASSLSIMSKPDFL